MSYFKYPTTVVSALLQKRLPLLVHSLKECKKRRDEGEKEEEREYIFYSESRVEKWIDKLLSNRRPGESLIEALLQVSLFTCIAN